MHVPPGLSWTELPSPRGWTLAVFDAAPWLAVAGLLRPDRRTFRRGVSVPGLALSALAGFLLWGGVISTRLRPEGRPGFALLFAVASGLLWVLAGRKAAAE